MKKGIVSVLMLSVASLFLIDFSPSHKSRGSCISPKAKLQSDGLIQIKKPDCNFRTDFVINRFEDEMPEIYSSLDPVEYYDGQLTRTAPDPWLNLQLVEKKENGLFMALFGIYGLDADFGDKVYFSADGINKESSIYLIQDDYGYGFAIFFSSEEYKQLILDQSEEGINSNVSIGGVSIGSNIWFQVLEIEEQGQ